MRFLVALRHNFLRAPILSIKTMSHGVPIILVFIMRNNTHCNINKKGRYVMQKRKALCCHKRRNAQLFSAFPTILDIPNIIVGQLRMLFLQGNSCISLSSFVNVIVRSRDA